MKLQTVSMKIILVLIILINKTIEGKSIANLEREELTSTTARNYRQMANVEAIRRNSSRISLPNIPADVEWIQSTTVRNEQQIIGSPVGSIVDLIFAVSSFSQSYHSKPVCYSSLEEEKLEKIVIVRFSFVSRYRLGSFKRWAIWWEEYQREADGKHESDAQIFIVLLFDTDQFL